MSADPTTRHPRPPWGPPGPGRAGLVLDLAAAALMGMVGMVALWTVDDYGITWDEIWHLVYGDHILQWLLTRGADSSALCYRLDFMYGGTFDLLGAVLRRLSPLSDIETIHRLGVVVGVLGLAGAWQLARRLAGPAAGLLAVALLASTSVYYGHMFANPKDLPFATGYIWALDALCLVAMSMPRVPRRAWIRLAILAGLAMGVRIAGLLVLVYLGALTLGWAWRRTKTAGSLDAGLATLRRLGLPTGLTMAGAWAVMLLPWPWALLDPLRRPFMALGRMSRFTIHRRTMKFAGESMLTTEPRWDYLPHYFGLKLPLLVLLLVLVAVLLVAAAWWRARLHGRTLDPTRRTVTLLLAAAILAPPAYAIVVRSIVYDGLRHFLFVVPPLTVVAAIAAVVVARRLARSPPRVAIPALTALGLCSAALSARSIEAMIRLHPYQYVYFNELVGGLPGADGNYDTDYYGTSYQEGFDALRRYLWEHERDRYLDQRYLVTGCIPDFIARHYIEGNFAWADNATKGAQFYLGYTRSDCHERYGTRPELLTVERLDTMLLLVRDLRGPKVTDNGRRNPPRKTPTRRATIDPRPTPALPVPHGSRRRAPGPSPSDPPP
ncbi:MAG: glycosyltransferase family 39 protein [Myxococcota bacterium]